MDKLEKEASTAQSREHIMCNIFFKSPHVLNDACNYGHNEYILWLIFESYLNF